MDKIYDSGLVDFIIKEFNYPETIILFSSFAKAENISRSHIDLLIVSSLKKDIELRKFKKIRL